MHVCHFGEDVIETVYMCVIASGSVDCCRFVYPKGNKKIISFGDILQHERVSQVCPAPKQKLNPERVILSHVQTVHWQEVSLAALNDVAAAAVNYPSRMCLHSDQLYAGTGRHMECSTPPLVYHA